MTTFIECRFDWITGTTRGSRGVEEGMVVYTKLPAKSDRDTDKKR